MKKTPYTMETTEQRLGGRGRNRTEGTQSTHNHVSIFNGIVTSAYIISNTDLGRLVLFLSMHLED